MWNSPVGVRRVLLLLLADWRSRLAKKEEKEKKEG